MVTLTLNRLLKHLPDPIDISKTLNTESQIPIHLTNCSDSIRDEEERENQVKLHFLVYEHVRNAKEIIQLIKAEVNKPGLEKQVPECLLLDANMIYDVHALELATMKAKLMCDQGINKTKSFLTEILYNLSPGTNIGESIRWFGLKEKSDFCILVMLVETQDQLQDGTSSDIAKDQFSLEENILKLDRLIQGKRKMFENIHDVGDHLSRSHTVIKNNDTIDDKKNHNDVMKESLSVLNEFLKRGSDLKQIKKIYSIDQNLDNEKLILDLIIGGMAIKGF